MEFSEDVRPESRLACQIPITDDLDGLVVTVPSS
jgi:2Fe-2S ferredoxin